VRAQTPAPSALALSGFLTGDPVRLGPDVASLDDLIAALALGGIARPGLLPLASDVVLIHSLTGETGHVTLRWVLLPHAPTLLILVPPLQYVFGLAPLALREWGVLLLPPFMPTAEEIRKWVLRAVTGRWGGPAPAAP
jgi:hypothetical protein